MRKLNYDQARYLKKLAHGLKPVIQIGKRRLAESVMQSIERALDDHELIKVKFVDYKDEKRELSGLIAERTGSIVVGTIGNVSILYRENPDEEKRKIHLPT